MLRWMKVFTWRLFAIASPLDGVVASNNAAILDFDISCRVGKLALCIGASAFVALKLATDFKLKPARVLNIKQGINNCHDINR